MLNLGHSFAHAIEAEAGIGRLLHGEAVALGLVLAFRLSTRLGRCPEGDSLRLAAHLRSVGLPTALDQVGLTRSGGALIEHMRADKKNRTDGFTLILANGIGRATLAKVPIEALTALFDSV